MTPRVHRSELLEYVHRPNFLRLDYSTTHNNIVSTTLASLVEICNTACNSKSSISDPLTTAKKSQTKALEQLKKFCRRAQSIHEELGEGPASYYIRTSIDKWEDAGKRKIREPFGRSDDDGGKFLLETLHRVRTNGSHPSVGGSAALKISRKCDKLIEFLTSHVEDQRHGIVFVEQRATVTVLHDLLSVHPRTKNVVKCGTFVGTSNISSRKASLGEWLDTSAQSETLESFKTKGRNIIIATSVLEEGIDISACNVVICFDKPPNLKSFIQRRGRARREQSTFVLMLSLEDRSLGPNMWERLERKMTEDYQTDAAERREIQQLEEVEEPSDARYEVRSTGYVLAEFRMRTFPDNPRALLTFKNAVAHIYHFCQTLPPQPYVDLIPTFDFQEDTRTKFVTAAVTLPNCVEPSVRVTPSEKRWRTEKMARKDAAFQAYIALHRKGLISDNLLPLFGQDEEITADIEKRRAVEEVSEIYDPWEEIALDWTTRRKGLCRKIISICRPGKTGLSMNMILPRTIPPINPFTLYWDQNTCYTISVHDHPSGNAVGVKFLPTMRRITSTILQSIYSRRMAEKNDNFVALFLPNMDEAALDQWLEANAGELAISEVLNSSAETPHGLVRNESLHGTPYIFQKLTNDDISIEVIALPRRRDFLHRGAVKADSTNGGPHLPARRIEILPIESSTIDKLDMDFVECALLIPSILHHLWRHLIAHHLGTAVLKDVDFIKLDYVITATNASRANATTNYQRMEFIGDSVLKYLVSMQLFARHPSWPEGYLTIAKHRIVANSRLARAAMEAGLDSYIVTEPFTAKKWSPPYISDNCQSEPPKRRTMSTKILADVVEGLIGGAYLDGGIRKAAACASCLVSDISSATPHEIFHGQFENSIGRRTCRTAINHLADLERLLGHDFNDNRLLREAMTHPSCQNDVETSSYQRLEFIGDAVLDMIVVDCLVNHALEMPPSRMNLIKSALVNANFLAFICLEAAVQQPVTDVHSNDGLHDFKEIHGSRSVPLCHFIKHQHPDIVNALSDCMGRYNHLRDVIKSSLDYGHCYPWVPLTSLEPQKFLSDLVESIFGAVFLDTKGNLEVCAQLAEKLGLIAYLRRLLNEDIDLLHPKNKLGEVAAGRTVAYILATQDEPAGYSCTVKVAGKEIVTALNGSSKNEATTRAAKMAADALAIADVTE
jgi:dsRNA-specific ribonuclease